MSTTRPQINLALFRLSEMVYTHIHLLKFASTAMDRILSTSQPFQLLIDAKRRLCVCGEWMHLKSEKMYDRVEETLFL